MGISPRNFWHPQYSQNPGFSVFIQQIWPRLDFYFGFDFVFPLCDFYVILQRYQHRHLDALFSVLSCVVSVPFYTAFLPLLFWVHLPPSRTFGDFEIITYYNKNLEINHLYAVILLL